MTFEELKAAIQSRIWDIFNQNSWTELDDFSLRLSEKIAKKMISSPSQTYVQKIVDSTKTNFFIVNKIQKTTLSKSLESDLHEIHAMYKPNKRKLKKKLKSTSKSKIKPRNDFSDDAKIQALRKQDHRCAICGRILGVVDWDHEDGDRSNDDHSNCRAICPYCHAIVSRRRQSLNHKTKK